MYRKDNNHEAPRKVTYVSPKVNGFQLGLSYIPDSSNTGSAVDYQLPKAFRRLKNVVSAIVIYGNKINGFDTALSLGIDKGTYFQTRKAMPHYDLQDYNIGVMLGKQGVNFAASYGNAGKSLKEKGDYNKYKEYYYSVGVAYNQEKYNVSLSYLGSKIGKVNRLSGDNYTILKAYSLGADYQILKGLQVYAEGTAYNVANSYIQKTILAVFGKSNILPNNKGFVFIMGGKIHF